MWEILFLIATNVQQKTLTHKLCSWISSHKLYKKMCFLCVHIKYMCQFRMNLKNFNLKEKT